MNLFWRLTWVFNNSNVFSQAQFLLQAFIKFSCARHLAH